jgi:hypothetical protein
MIEMVGPVLGRALGPFPIPVRTLDAIHLSALEFIAIKTRAWSWPVMTNVWLRPRGFSELHRGARTSEFCGRPSQIGYFGILE